MTDRVFSEWWNEFYGEYDDTWRANRETDSDVEYVTAAQLESAERQIADLQRQNELLRAVVEAGQVYVNENWNPHKTMTPESAEANLIRLLQAAIDGGAMGEG